MNAHEELVAAAHAVCVDAVWDGKSLAPKAQMLVGRDKIEALRIALRDCEERVSKRVTISGAEPKVLTIKNRAPAEEGGA